jgi:PAS domain S-box-containing protein
MDIARASCPEGEGSATGRGEVAPGKILVVDDDDYVRHLLRAVLEAHGYAVAEAVSAGQALASVRHDRPDLILLDLGLPDTNGLEVLRRVHSGDPTIGVIVVTGRHNEALVRSMCGVGALDYVAKPVDLQDLERVVQRGMETVRRAASDNNDATSPEVDGRRGHIAELESAQAVRTRVEAVGLAAAEITRALAGSLDLDRVTEMIVTTVLRLLQSTSAALYERDAATGALRCVAVAGGADPQPWVGLMIPAGHGVVGRALAEGRVVWSPDFLADPRIIVPDQLRARALETGSRSVVAVPLRVCGELIGALGIGVRAGRIFSDEEIRLAQAFADQAAVALRNAQLYHEAARRRREAEVVAELARTINASLDLDVVLQQVADGARALCASDMAMIALRDPVSDAMVVRYRSGANAEACTDRHVEPGQGIGGQVLLTGRAVRTDAAARTATDRRAWDPSEADVASMAVPITIGQRIEGLLCAQNRARRPFGDREEAVLTQLANHAAIAIANAQLYAAAQARTRRLDALRHVTRLVSSSLDIEQVLAEIARAAANLTNAAAASLWIADERAQTLDVRAFADPRVGDDFSARRQPIGDGLTGWVAKHRRSLHVPDVAADARTLNADWWRAHGLTSFYGMPIIDGERLVGVLTLKDSRPFALTSDDTDILEAFVAQAAVAIRNAWLFETSERRRQEAEATAHALAESEARYRGLVEASMQGIWIHTDFIIRFANQTSAHMFGFEDAAALVDRDLRDFVAPHERARLEGYYSARLRGEPAPRRYDFEAVRPDGRRIWVQNVATVITWQDEPAVLVALLDVTEMKQLEEQSRQSQKMEAIGQLAGGVAHDFNNLLTVIEGRSEMQLAALPPASAPYRDAKLIHGAAQRAAALTRQLLAFSRKQVLQPRVLNLNEVISNLVPMLRRLIGEHIRCATVLAADLGPMRADPGQLEQVLMNLAVNARDAMPGGGVLTIESANVELDESFARRHIGAQPGPHVMLAVSDSGIGMDEETRAHIFEPFFTTKEAGKGTGLGLSTVDGIVQQSGGTICVESEAGRGTTFRIYFPRIDGAASAAERHAAASRAARGVETILLVEDDDAVRDLAREVLEASGYSVLAVGSPREAFGVAARHEGPIHLLITDVVMPELGGRECAARLTASRPGMRVLYISGYTDDAITRHGIVEGGVDFLQKPFTPAAMALKVRTILDTARPGAA